MTNNNLITIETLYNTANSGLYLEPCGLCKEPNSLYIEPYFTKLYHIRDEIYANLAKRDIEYNVELISSIYFSDFDEEDAAYCYEEAEVCFWRALAACSVHVEPQQYQEEVAVKCGLIPFKYYGEDKIWELLGLCDWGMTLLPRLDAYQALSSGTIDKYSQLFFNYDYFKKVIGEEVTQEVVQAITKTYN